MAKFLGPFTGRTCEGQRLSREVEAEVVRINGPTGEKVPLKLAQKAVRNLTTPEKKKGFSFF